MARLILHIGTHKTGTTAIQNWLASRTRDLAREGWHYGATDRPPYPWNNKHNSLFSALREERFEGELQAILADHAASGLPNLILSEEGLSLPCFVKFRAVRALARHYDITVVALFRRQDLFIESFWNQMCKQGNCGRNLETFATTDWNRRRMDYASLLDFWAGFTRIRAAAYQPGHPGGAVAQFLDAAELPLDPGPRRLSNPSVSMNVAALLCWLNGHRMSWLTPPSVVLFSADRQKYGLGRRLRRQILAEQEAGNARLRDHYGICFPEVFPDEPEEPITVPDPAALLRAVLRLPTERTIAAGLLRETRLLTRKREPR